MTSRGVLEFSKPHPPHSLVSVIVTTMDRYDNCRRCIDSVTLQDYPNIEIIVIEDGSCSGIEDYIGGIGTRDIRYIRQNPRLGLSAARNAGIAAAGGKFVAFIDDDDAWYPTRISKQMEYWSNISADEVNSLAMIYCGAELRNSAEKRVATIFPVNRGLLKASALEHGMRTIPSTYLFQRDALAAIGGFDEQLPSSVDHDIWMALAAAGYAIDFVPDPLVITYERIGRDTMMSRTGERIRGVRLFASKWRNTWREWYGPRSWEYADDYSARVISTLAADHAAQGRFCQMLIAGREALSGARWRPRVIGRLAIAICRGLARGLRSQVRTWARSA